MDKVSLDDIRWFVVVAQAGSLSRAAELTGIPVSRLSRRLTELEQALGTKLMDRGKKGVRLNPMGERFFEHGQHMLQQAHAALASVQEKLAQPSGLLRLSVAGDVYHYLLAPILPDYLSTYPEVQLDIQLSHHKIGMIQDGVDIALRAGTIDNDDVVARSVTTLAFGLFASPEYLARHGTPHTPHDLYQHQLLAQSLTLPWRFQHQQQTVSIKPLPRVATNDFLAVEKLVHQGAGIGLLLSAASASGLVPVLQDWQLPSAPLSLLYYKNRGAMPAVRSFAQWLSEKIGSGVATP